MTETNSSSDPPARPAVTLWYDARFSRPPRYKVVAVIIAENNMPLTGYLDDKDAWRVVGLKDGHVSWWSDCVPTPLPNPRLERERLAHERRGA
jgi:hypothetical protein